jgi:hypothetical protein
MNEFIIWLLVLGAISFFFLILRFIQPELIYTLRQAIVKVEINKAFLESDELCDTDDEAKISEDHFKKALAKDFRSESRRYDREYVSDRLQKIKELYRLQHGMHKNKNYQICIVELSNLLSSVAHNLSLQEDNQYKLTYAEDVLKFLSVQRIANNDEVSEATTIEEWFESNPISVEQSLEVLSAVIFALLLRENNSMVKKDVDNS